MLRLERTGCVVNGQMTTASNKCVRLPLPPPPPLSESRPQSRCASALRFSGARVSFGYDGCLCHEKKIESPPVIATIATIATIARATAPPSDVFLLLPVVILNLNYSHPRPHSPLGPSVSFPFVWLGGTWRDLTRCDAMWQLQLEGGHLEPGHNGDRDDQGTPSFLRHAPDESCECLFSPRGGGKAAPGVNRGRDENDKHWDYERVLNSIRKKKN